MKFARKVNIPLFVYWYLTNLVHRKFLSLVLKCSIKAATHLKTLIHEYCLMLLRSVCKEKTQTWYKKETAEYSKNGKLGTKK